MKRKSSSSDRCTVCRPAKVVGNPADDDLAIFLLEGRFKKACDSGEKPTDELMNEIRIDAHNKMYSLLNVIFPE